MDPVFENAEEAEKPVHLSMNEDYAPEQSKILEEES